ncbi:eukaryotic translation initiation factor 4E type 2 isoform X2 [Mirounga leonina]|uniref:eukaryotic translation initiation factor 4E type 2 isoform X2 n=1 Tax=Mirounga leonina TaxID=9715 RepID=UPI00156BE594|nr:eukaryotic translation initiation factor 4E type 2 isoform X2 [Mirounga leonina]
MNNKFDALKDDDSGDHDQNEENSTQKDGEKEKTERDKSQGSSKRKAVVPGPAEHPLQYNYTFWYSRRTPGRPTSSQSYEQNIKQIGTFASVEQFWRFYSHMVRPGDLTGHSDFHLFKEGIKPMWEDDANKNGGKWIIRLRKGLASRCWENLILAMLGEQFMVGEEICGAVVSVRFQEDIISIWNKTASDQATTARIRDTLRRVLNLPPNTIMEYKTHTDSIKYVLGVLGGHVPKLRRSRSSAGPGGIWSYRSLTSGEGTDQSSPLVLLATCSSSLLVRLPAHLHCGALCIRESPSAESQLHCLGLLYLHRLSCLSFTNHYLKMKDKVLFIFLLFFKIISLNNPVLLPLHPSPHFCMSF